MGIEEELLFSFRRLFFSPPSAARSILIKVTLIDKERKELYKTASESPKQLKTIFFDFFFLENGSTSLDPNFFCRNIDQRMLW